MQRLAVDDQNREQIRTFLRKISPFGDLSVLDLNELMDRASIWRADAGETAFRQGDDVEAVFIALTPGWRAIERTSFFSRTVADIEAGSAFGAIAFYRPETHGFSLRAKTPALLFGLPFTVIDEMMMDRPRLRRAFDAHRPHHPPADRRRAA